MMLNIFGPRGMRWRMLSLVVVLTVWSCASSIAVFNQRAYENATTLKAEAYALMDKASEPFADHADEVQAFMTLVDAAYEYAKGIPKNELSANQWRILKDPDGNLLGGFFRLWKKKETLLKADRDAIRKNVMDGFDTIIELEAAKINNP